MIHILAVRFSAYKKGSNKFLVSLPGIVTVFGVLIDILAKVKFANLRKKELTIFFVLE